MSDQAQPAAPPVDAGNGAAPEAQGQDQGANGNDALYQEYVASQPEELRPYLIDVLRQQDAKITPRLQEAARLRERFEPYAQVEGFDSLQPEDIKEFIDFRSEILSDPATLGAWMGWMVQENPEVLPNIPEDLWEHIGTENGWFDGGGEGEEAPPADDGPPAWFEQYAREQEERLAPVLQTVQTQQQEQELGQIRERFTARLGELEGEHGELDDGGRNAVLRLATSYAQTSDDPIGDAFAELMRLTGRAEGEATDRKLAEQNGGPVLRGSTPDTSPPQYAHNDPELRKAALARFRG